MDDVLGGVEMGNIYSNHELTDYQRVLIKVAWRAGLQYERNRLIKIEMNEGKTF